MIEFDDEHVADKNILNLFHLLSCLNVVKINYEEYGLEWGSRQNYIYRRLVGIAM